MNGKITAAYFVIDFKWNYGKCGTFVIALYTRVAWGYRMRGRLSLTHQSCELHRGFREIDRDNDRYVKMKETGTVFVCVVWIKDNPDAT